MKILVVPGDGIGPEITDAAVAVMLAAGQHFGVGFELETAPCGLVGLRDRGITVNDEDIAAARRADGVILGPMSVHEYPAPEEGGVNVPAKFRRGLELFANQRPCYTREGVPSVIKSMDLVFMRENLEDFYTDRNMFRGNGEVMLTPDVAMAMGKITRQGSNQIARAAFELARTRPRKKVTIVHKTPVLKLYHGLFLEEALAVSRDYPDIAVDELMVDAAAAHLVRSPERFDVILTTNMFGDILSDEAAELAGSLGLSYSLNFGHDAAVAQAGHGSAPDIAGRNVANPAAMIQSMALLLDYLGRTRSDDRLTKAAAAIHSSVDEIMRSPDQRTPDIGGSVGTSDFGALVAANIKIH